jgi:hypothetical protein
MSAMLTWVHIGDLHLDEADGWTSLERLRAIVSELNEHVGTGADFVFLPGDNANHGTPEQYARLVEALAPLALPWRIIPGDHDVEPGDLVAYEAAVPEANRPEVEPIAGHRCLFLDIVSAGAGGPDFRLTMHDRNRIREELARAEAAGEVPVVFMHAYPGDLAADGDGIARAFADGHVAYVDTGHTHFNELLNDGRVVYGATRSTGPIEEDGGRPGFAIVCVRDRVPSWRFRRLGATWPHVQILAPCDRRLVTRPADRRQVPRPGEVTIVAGIFSATDDAQVLVSIDGGAMRAMQRDGDDWTAIVQIDDAGLHTVEVRCGEASDRIDVLVRDLHDIPKGRPPVALGHECQAVGAWPQAGIDGAQLGPNKNGRVW